MSSMEETVRAPMQGEVIYNQRRQGGLLEGGGIWAVCSLKDQWAVFSYTAFCPFSQSPDLETVSILRGADPIRGEKAVGHLAELTYRPLFVAVTKGPSP